MYEIARINDDGTKTVIGATDLNFVSVGLAYDLLENKVTATLDKYMDSRDLKSEDKIKLLATTIGNIVTQSMSTVELEMKVKLLDAQIENEKSNLLIKDQQELGERLKNGGLYYEYTTNTDGTVTKTLIHGTTKSIYEVQKEVEEARIRQVDEELSMKRLQNSMDLLIKDQQEISERIKNGGIHYTYTYYLATDTEVITGIKKVGDIKTKVLNAGTSKSIYELDFDSKLEQIATAKASLEKQYGAKIGAGGSVEYVEEKSVISEQIAGFKLSNIKEVYKSSMQGIGMIYNAGETIPSWLVDIAKRTAEVLSEDLIDLVKNQTTSETEMTTDTTWNKDN